VIVSGGKFKSLEGSNMAQTTIIDHHTLLVPDLLRILLMVAILDSSLRAVSRAPAENSYSCACVCVYTHTRIRVFENCFFF
jgi:hypothetical protein